MMTDIVRSPGMIAAYEGGWMDVPPLETLQPADFGRATFPNYPDTVQSILVGTVTSNAAVFNGTVQRPNPSTLTAGAAEACYIFDLNGGTFTTGENVYGRLIGPLLIGSQTLPLYSLISGGSGGSAGSGVKAGVVAPSTPIGAGFPLSSPAMTLTNGGGLLGEPFYSFGPTPPTLVSGNTSLQINKAGYYLVTANIIVSYSTWTTPPTSGAIYLAMEAAPDDLLASTSVVSGAGSLRLSGSTVANLSLGDLLSLSIFNGTNQTWNNLPSSLEGTLTITEVGNLGSGVGSGQITAVLNNDATFFTNTLTSIFDLIVPLAAGKYAGRLDIWVQNSTPIEGAQFDFGGGSAIITNFLAGAGIFASGSPTYTQVNTIAFAIGTVLNWSTITGYVNIVFDFSITCATAGTFAFRIAENSSHTSGTVTVKAGANIRIDPLS
jgi:hypothetical protein